MSRSRRTSSPGCTKTIMVGLVHAVAYDPERRRARGRHLRRWRSPAATSAADLARGRRTHRGRHQPVRGIGDAFPARSASGSTVPSNFAQRARRRCRCSKSAVRPSRSRGCAIAGCRRRMDHLAHARPDEGTPGRSRSRGDTIQCRRSPSRPTYLEITDPRDLRALSVRRALRRCGLVRIVPPMPELRSNSSTQRSVRRGGWHDRLPWTYRAVWP